WSQVAKELGKRRSSTACYGRWKRTYPTRSKIPRQHWTLDENSRLKKMILDIKEEKSRRYLKTLEWAKIAGTFGRSIGAVSRHWWVVREMEKSGDASRKAVGSVKVGRRSSDERYESDSNPSEVPLDTVNPINPMPYLRDGSHQNSRLLDSVAPSDPLPIISLGQEDSIEVPHASASLVQSFVCLTADDREEFNIRKQLRDRAKLDLKTKEALQARLEVLEFARLCREDGAPLH
ncbi:hypothetical protein P7C70_g3741, partial [Phenoliferia sp. Uapishka_3]